MASTVGERSLEFLLSRSSAEDMVALSASDWPHGDKKPPLARKASSRPSNDPRLSETAKRKILGENALRLCPALEAV